MSVSKLRARIRESLEDTEAQRTYASAMARARSKRLAAIDALPDWEEQRDRAAESRTDAIDNMDALLAQFEQSFSAAGGVVHRAENAREACEIVAGILEEHQARRVIKGKSMLTEEIALNAHLEAKGLEVMETDLGEYIIQLAKQRPSHITAPALHMNRRDIGRLFADTLDMEYTEDPVALAGIARERLRQSFLEADAGITGGNFLVAETGQILLLENEANLRMCTTLPRLHIAVVGLEKIVRNLEDLGPLLTVIARSTTGQKMGSYVSLLGAAGEPPRHVVLVDNGRRNVWGQPKRRQILGCIRCGACLNACPVYESIGGHAYDSTYSGPIGALLATHHIGTDEGQALPFASSLCGACADVCPVKIDIPELLRGGRERYVETSGASVAERLGWWIWSKVLVRPRLYRVLSGMIRGILASQVGDELRWGLLRPWDEGPHLPRPAAQSFLDQWKARREGFKDEEKPWVR